ncbi:neutral zinc metallopeptidase [Mycobacterium sp. ITM-2016-00316]|uniref:neutral zinc metallopeptidase n=1 Tax=Mycobacterium sp. ITM-2016-00316 TaxID=2099695 RepID=UPI000CFA604E|nr:neutral zinc metallopeptidase [Mycobacterium sp. ITM-2016-00316]WNG80535.1 neutral zinc metallopeptidase [Mycobacterium sp. ITM-2016-00316]
MHRRAGRLARWLSVALITALALTGCGTTMLDGRAVSMLYDPSRAGGLPASDGPSGPRPDAPAPTRTAENSDGGPVDQLALRAIDDLEQFWSENWNGALTGTYSPVAGLVSYDAADPDTPQVCGNDLYGLSNAFYCFDADVMAWDRGEFIPGAAQYFGEMGVVGVMAHEYGHAVQAKAHLVEKSTPVLVKEQQADCFAGVYLHWVAAGKSPRFALSTGDGLNHVLAGAIYIRDPLMTQEEAILTGDAHGSALDRISAFQIGFSGNADQCAAIDMEEIIERQGDLPKFLSYDSYGDPSAGNSVIDADLLNSLMNTLADVYSPDNPPALNMEMASCPDAESISPAAYCPATNTINVNLPALQELGTPKSEEQGVLLQGDNTALSIITSRYALAVQQERGIPLESPVTALRTACLTGVAQGRMAEPGSPLTLSAGDTDEAISGLLTNGLAASDVNGVTATAGFTRILAYRAGLSGDPEQCYERFSA